MTWSMTLADLPIAGKTSKPHDYQQNVQKMQDLSKTWVFNEKRVWKLQTKKEKKQNSPPFKNTLWNTVPLNTTVHSNKYCAGYKINSLGPKSLLKTLSVEKKTRQSFQWKKNYLTVFSPFIEFDKPQGTNFNGPQGFLTIIVQMTRPFLWELRGR